MNRILKYTLLFFAIAQFLFYTGCKKKEVPTLITSEITDVTGTSTYSGGTITDEGSGTVVERGVCWSKDITPLIADNWTTEGVGAGTFISKMDNLDAATTYYVRAYASNEAGTGYGMAMSFKTLGQAPTATTLAATNIDATIATLNGSVNANDLTTVVTFEYGTTTNYGQAVTALQSPVTGSINMNVNANVAGLQEGITYHFRVRTVNSLGTTNGDDIRFTTKGQAPTAITQSATNVTPTSARLNGVVNANYLSTTITFEYGTTSNYGQTITATQSPLTGNTITNVSANITGLTAGTIYHNKVKAINSLGTTYGSELTFVYTVTDVEGNIYNTIAIGTQVWMKENLKSTKFNNGTSIPLVSNGTTWVNPSTPAYCWYNNDATTYKATYGALYNWYATSTGKLCPNGWHEPNDVEWTILTNYLGGENIAGGKLKEAGTTHWISPNTGATNESSFTALPGGYRDFDGTFKNINSSGH